MQVRTQAQPDNRLFHGRGRIPMLEVFEGAPMSALKRAVDATNNVLADYGTVCMLPFEAGYRLSQDKACEGDVADSIIAALTMIGWRPPVKIATLKGLDRLPVGSIIRKETKGGTVVAEKRAGFWGNYWEPIGEWGGLTAEELIGGHIIWEGEQC